MNKYVTTYKVTRDSDNETCVYFVNAECWGIGFQVNINGTVYGISFHTTV